MYDFCSWWLGFESVWDFEADACSGGMMGATANFCGEKWMVAALVFKPLFWAENDEDN